MYATPSTQMDSVVKTNHFGPLECGPLPAGGVPLLAKRVHSQAFQGPPIGHPAEGFFFDYTPKQSKSATKAIENNRILGSLKLD